MEEKNQVVLYFEPFVATFLKAISNLKRRNPTPI
jgi:hypothetical protein